MHAGAMADLGVDKGCHAPPPPPFFFIFLLF